MACRWRRFAVWSLLTFLAAGAGILPAEVQPESDPGEPRVLLTSVAIDDIFTGNASLWIEPGETVELQLKLANDGNETAVAPIGVLQYLGGHPEVTLSGKSAVWPNLPPLGLPETSGSPPFQLQVGSSFPCGLDLPFRLVVSEGSGHLFEFEFSLRVGQRTTYDMIHDASRRFNEQEATLWGEQGTFGRALDTGDFNGDGIADLLVGAPDDSTAGAGAGAAFIIYGSRNRWPDADMALPVPGVARFTGAAAGDHLGLSVAAGDVNGDGYDDAIVGIGRTEVNPGRVHIIYGQATMWTDTALTTAPPPAGTDYVVGEAEDVLGRSVATGDVNGDGLDDVIMSAWYGDGPDNSRINAGEVQILLGSADSFTCPGCPMVRIHGAMTSDGFGTTVGAVDLNGDGFDDVIAADTFTEIGEGQVIVVYGKSGWAQDVDLLTATENVTRFVGPAYGSAFLGEPFGQATFPSGDLNGDGYEDFVIADTRTSPAGIVRDFGGVAFLVYGKPGVWEDVNLQAPPGGVVRFWGPVDDAGLGAGAMGDLNGDGYDDLVLSAPEAEAAGRSRAGRVFLLPGRAAPWVDTDLADLPPSGSIFEGADTLDNSGFALATGDLDGDGVADLANGVFRGDSIANSRFNAGEVYLWYGKPTETYYLQVDSPAYIDASSGDLLDLACDDCSVSMPIGFDFPFYGEMLDTIQVSSNGFLSFGPIQDETSFVPFCTPDRRYGQSIVAPFWDDLDPSAGGPGSGVYSLLEGVAPNRRLTIEWKGIPLYGGMGDATFEVTLFESTGQIMVQYQDAVFGDQGHDYGAGAVIGLENRAGVLGRSVSCGQPAVAAGTSFRWIPTTPIVETDFEHGVGLWQESGTPTIWGLSDGACEPDSASGDTSWYFGFEPACNYDSGGQSTGSLHVPTIPNFPADGRLTFWDRRQTEGTAGFDLSKVQISNSGTGGAYSDVLQLLDEADLWIYQGVTSLFGNGGDTIDLRFFFDTVDSSLNAFLGWMVDDVQVVGCGAEGVLTAGAEAMAFARPASYCEGGTGLVDSTGSFCLDTGAVAGYQWREDGVDIPGATAGSYVIPSSQSSGAYEYSVAITCSGGAMDESAPAPISIVPPPATVGATLMVDLAAGQLQLSWDGVAGADDYAVYSSLDPAPAFTNLVGTSPSGVSGLSTTIPPDDIVYYLVAGRNGTCGEGAQR